jgi:hypothetical protein
MRELAPQRGGQIDLCGQQPRSTDGSGCLGLADRHAVLDGQLRVDSPAGGGTLVAVVIP